MLENFIKLQKINGSIRVEGDRTVAGAKGNEVAAQWSFDGETLVAENDVYGMQPFFYFERTDEFCLSFSLVKLLQLGAPTDFDDQALAVFLRIGFFIGDDTPFRHIRAVPPASKLTWQNGVLNISSQGYFKPQPTMLSRGEIVEKYAQLFRLAIERRLPSNNDFAVPLSGGRDSRYILLELLRAGAKPRECLTLAHQPPRANEDAIIAAQVCRELNVAHVVLPQPESMLQPELEKNLLTHFCADEHAWYLPLAKYAKRFDCLYDGLVGDVLTGEQPFSDEVVKLVAKCFEENNLREAAGTLLDEGYLPNLLQKEVYERLNRELAIEHLSKEFERHAGAPNPFMSFHFYNRSRREVGLAPFSILNVKTRVLAPFIDQDFFQFAMSVPMRIGLRAKMRDSAINLSFPEFSRIPYENKHASLVKDNKLFRKFSLELYRYADLSKSSQFITRAFWAPRLTRCLLDPNYSSSVNSFGVQMIYLLQLERFVNNLAAPN